MIAGGRQLRPRLRYDPAVRKVLLLLPLLSLVSGCGESKTSATSRPAKNPVSVRGWFSQVEVPKSGDTVAITSPEIEQARLEAIFYEANLSVDNVPYATGGIATNGSFLVLDVPPGDAQIDLVFPGLPTSLKLTLKNVPPNADVFLPNLIVTPTGVTISDPQKAKIRVVSANNSRKQTGQTAVVAGVPIAVEEVPFSELADRRNFPEPGGLKPIATVK